MDTIEAAIEELNKENLIAIPTETVYGLAANAFSEKAVKKIFELKRRPSYNPLIVHISSLDELEKVATEIPDKARELAKNFWPGPLTLVLKKKDCVAPAVTAGLDTVAVRIPNHPLVLELLQKLEFPLAAPSANPFGSISPTKADHVRNYFGDKLEIILDGGECEKGIESTIIGFDHNEDPILYRHGSIALEEVEGVVGKVKLLTRNDTDPNAPGMLSKHYSPTTESFLTTDVESTIKKFAGKRIGLLLFKEGNIDQPNTIKEVLSKTGDLREAARNLYAAMHRLDQKRPDVIIFEQLPEEDLGIAINDKLKRAAKK